MLPIVDAAASLRAAAADYNILFGCFCNAKGLLATLNWALHAAAVGVPVVVGIDGPAPTPESLARWRRTQSHFVLLPTFEEAVAVSQGRPLRARRHAHERSPSQKGFQFWLVRWYGVLQLLELGVDVMLSDSDVTWHRDPRPYLRALSAAHPLLDVLIHSDHSLYAEDLREDVSYLSASSPDRRALLAAYQTIRPVPAPNRSGASTSAAAAPHAALPPPPDFDLDPRPARGFAIGTWNPGLLFVRGRDGGRAMIAAWMADFADKGRRRVKPHSALSSQSEMNVFLRTALGSADRDSLADRHPRDKRLFRVGLPRPSATFRDLLWPGARGGRQEATLGLLPAHQFGSFAATHLVREAQLYGAQPFCTHATQIHGEGIVFRKNNVGHMGACPHEDWCLGGGRVTAATVKAFTQRHFGLWRVPDRDGYFAANFLSYSPRASKRLRTFEITSRGSRQWDRHLALLQEQLQEFQTALALALALNRTLVLPRLLCGCVFAQWPFINEGNANCQPMHMQGLHPRLYECLPSYWLNLPELIRSGLPLREAYFLRYPRARALTRHSRLALYPCEAEQPDGDDRTAAPSSAASSPPASARAFCSARGQQLMRALPSSSEATSSLGSLGHVRLLHFESIRDAFGGFDSAADAKSFAARVSPVLGAWCCKEGGRSLDGDKFPLSFAPWLGAATASRRYSRSRPKAAWRRAPSVNNVFGRAELRRDTACCKYLGTLPSLARCVAAAERYAQPVTSITYHLPRGEGESSSPWQGTCYAIVDGTWLPVKVQPGQARADSARRAALSAPPREAHLPDGFVSEELWMLPAEAG